MTAALGYMRRDFLIWSSYRLSMFWQITAAFMFAAVVYFAGTAVGDRSDIIEEEGGSLVAFILVGIAFMDILSQGMASLAIAVRDHQRAGTLEPMLLAPIPDSHLLVSFWLFPFCVSWFRSAIMIGFGMLILGFWHSANPLTIAAVVVPAALTFLALGALSAAFIILVKQGDPVRVAYTAAMATLGGTFFPTEVLPGWMQTLAAAMPLTHALTGIREGLSGAAVSDVTTQIIILSAMTALLLPISMYVFSWSLLRAKREGALAEY